MFFFIFSKRGKSFPQRIYYFQYNSGLGKTRLTKNGLPPEPNLRMASLTSEVKAYVHPNPIVLPENRPKARVVVFASREDIPEFW